MRKRKWVHRTVKYAYKTILYVREKKIKYYIQGSVTNVVDELHSKEMTSSPFIRRVLSGMGEWQSCSCQFKFHAGYNCLTSFSVRK